MTKKAAVHACKDLFLVRIIMAISSLHSNNIFYDRKTLTTINLSPNIGQHDQFCIDYLHMNDLVL